jgi:hypothetical protein
MGMAIVAVWLLTVFLVVTVIHSGSDGSDGSEEMRVISTQ